MDCIEKRITRQLAAEAAGVHVTFQLPADQITPDLAEKRVLLFSDTAQNKLRATAYTAR